MSLWSFFHGNRSAKGTGGRSARSTPSRRGRAPLALELLEGRITPVSHTWTGTNSANWSDPGNWNNQGGISIQTDTGPVDLVFSTGAARTATNNNLANLNIDQITISGSSYTLAGNAITLGGPTESGLLHVTPAGIGATINLNMTMGGSPSNNQTVQVDGGADLTVSGLLSSGAGNPGLTKSNAGTLTLSGVNAGFTGAITVANNGGVLDITNNIALGTGTSPVTIDQSGELALNSVASPVNRALILNGPGAGTNAGALFASSGSSTWAGPITLDSNSALGGNFGTVLTISGQISDNTSHDLSKEGRGQVVFSHVGGNFYHGNTTIDNGILTITDPGALGNNALNTSTTTVNATSTGQGTLQLDDPTGVGFTVQYENLILNGLGFDPTGTGTYPIGALNNLSGPNAWAGTVTLNSANPAPGGGSPTFLETPGIGVAPQTTSTSTDLAIYGVVNDTLFPGTNWTALGLFQLVKLLGGRLILTNNNTFSGDFDIYQGVVNVRDSHALGNEPTDPTTGGYVNIENGAALELQVDSGLDPNGRDLGDDSVTHDPLRLQINKPLFINGVGPSNTGALHSISGINTWTGPITLGTLVQQSPVVVAPEAFTNSIAVDLDQTGVNDTRPGHPLADNTYFTNDWSLTITGGISGPTIGPDIVALAKQGAGQLILPTANSYLGPTYIEQGWITVQNDQAFGPLIPGVGDTAQPPVLVDPGAALHLMPLTPTSPPLDLIRNLILSGTGISHPYAAINQQGALENLGGLNTVGGTATDTSNSTVQLNGAVAIGVQQVDPTIPSELTITAPISDAHSQLVATGISLPPFSLESPTPGNPLEQATTIDTGTLSGTIAVTYDFLVPLPNFGTNDELRIYYPPRGFAGSTLLADTGLVGGVGNVAATPFGPGNQRLIEIVVNEGAVSTFPEWTWNATITPNWTAGSLIKLGPERLTLQGANTFTGTVDIQNGVVRDQNDTGLGAVGGDNVTVEYGTALELAGPIPQFDGGNTGGIEVWGKHLILNGAGNPAFGDAPLVNLSDDNMWRGAVTLNTVATTFSVTFPGSAVMSANGTLLTGTNPTLGVAPGTSSAVQSITFGGVVTGGTFTLTVNTGSGNVMTGPIQWSTNGTTLATNIQTALNTALGAGTSSVTVASATIDVAPASRLTLFSNVDDAPNPAPLVGSDLIKVDTGELALAGTNTYRGITLIAAGILDIESDGALGTSTSPVIVANGAQIQLVGNVNIAGKSLTISGTGVGSVPTYMPLSWFNIGPAPVTNSQTPGSLNSSGRVNGVVSDPTDPNVIYIATAGGGAWKTIDGGQTWTPLFDGISAVQQVTIANTTGTFTLQFGPGASTPTNTTTALAWNATAAQVQAALDALQTIGGGGGTVTVNLVGNVYSITFGGTLAQQNVPTMTAAGTAGATVATTIAGSGPQIAEHDGAIAMSPSDPRVLYLGTGEANDSGDSYAGTGVYKSTDSGKTWTLLTDPVIGNPLFGQGITRIVVGEDANGNDIVYVASSDEVVHVPATVAATGVWRFDGTNWVNLTAGLAVPQNTTTWSDLALVNAAIPGSETLYAALGDPNNNFGNGVYFAQNPYIGAVPAWTMSTGVGTNPGGIGNIKITAVPTNPAGPSVFPNITVYAGVTQLPNVLGQYPLNGVYVSNNGGTSFAPTGGQPQYMGTFASAQGDFDSTIVVSPTNPQIVWVGGQEVDPVTMLQNIYVSMDGGATWTDISIDGNGNGPHTDEHAMAVDSLGRLLVGNDGGMWRWVANPAPLGTWTDINGNLATIQFNSVAPNPSNLNAALGGSQDNGVEFFNGGLTAPQVDTGDGGVVHYGTQNGSQQLAYHVANGDLVESTDGGATWNPNPILSTGGLYFPVVVDPFNPGRIVTTDGVDVVEAIDQAEQGIAPGSWTWNPLFAPVTPTAIALAEFQGTVPLDPTARNMEPANTFIADPDFRMVKDLGSSSDDPNTIYITDGFDVYVTKNHGLTWAGNGVLGTLNRTPNLNANTDITDLEVDPTNRDTVYVVTEGFIGTAGVQRVFKSTDAGISWTDISAGLPDLSAYKLAIDPRNGNLYLGTDNGVWILPGGSGTWQRFGLGMPQVAVFDLELNMSLNTLTAGTYGRSAYVFYLDEVLPVSQPNSGALRVLSGSATWSGPINLVGDTTISVLGAPSLPDKSGTAQFNISGVINDWTDPAQTVHGNFTLTKTGLGDLTLSGANAYNGLTLVQQGELIVSNPQALGPTGSAPTVVSSGAALDLQSDLVGESITLSGDGFGLLNGHNTGALRSIANTNHYSGGTITLNSDVTIGVDSNSTLIIDSNSTIAQAAASPPAGPPPFGITKELTGTLVFMGANSYGGGTHGTNVNQGVLNIQNANALGVGGTTTTVLDGAQLQIQGGITVANEALDLSGTGITNDGALKSISGANQWQGVITLDQKAAFSPSSNPPTNVAIGVSLTTAADSLTIGGGAGTIGQANGTLGLTKVGGGTLILANADTYRGMTTVSAGALRVQNPFSIGGAGFNTSEVQTVTVDTTGAPAGATFQLTFNGQTTAAITAVGATAAQVQALLDTLSTIGGVGGFVTVTQNLTGNLDTFTVTFGGTFTGLDQPLLSISGPNLTVGTAPSQDGAGGTLVSAGASLQLDLGTGSHTVSGEAIQLNGRGLIFQLITLGGASTGSYRLSFGSGPGSTTALLPFNTPASGGVGPTASIQNALNALATIGGVGGSVTVGPFGGNSFLVAFGGGLAGTAVAPLSAAGSNGTTASVSVVSAGTGALENLSGDNTWAGFPVVLSAGASTQTDAIGVDGGSLALTGNTLPGVPAAVSGPAGATLAKFGPGTLSLPTANTYLGATQVLDGVLNIGNAAALGGTDVATVTVTGTTGTFTLTYNNQTTTALSVGATAAQVRDALNALLSISGANGSVTVSAATVGTTTTYTVTFLDALAGFNAPAVQLSGIGSGPTVNVSTVHNGGAGTLVANGGTLQLQGNINVATESLTLNGPGSNGLGALENVAGFSDTWSAPITLSSSSTIAVDGAADTLTIPAPIGDGGSAFGITKIQPGTLDYQAANTYTGPTLVNAGTLLLDNSTGTAILGPLTVGTALPGSPATTARWLFANEMPTTALAMVNATGTLDLNDKSQTLTSLTITDGLAKSGTGTTAATLTINGLNMTGGTLSTGAGGTQNQVVLGGNVAATSSATQTALINGKGNLSLGGVARVFTITRGTGTLTIDLDLVAPLVSGGGTPGLTKNGNGVLQIDPINTTSTGYGLTTVTNGTLEVDGKIGAVALAAVAGNPVTLSGTGTVGDVTTNNGPNTLSPGSQATPTGTLKAQNVTLDPASTYFVDLTSAPLVGSNLSVPTTGTVRLNNATLAGKVDAGVQVGLGQSFTILTTGGSGVLSNASQFVQGSSAFVGGDKFNIAYTTTAGASTIVLTPVLANVTTTFPAASAPTLLYSQATTNTPATYTATVTPEAGATIPGSANDKVTFKLFKNGNPNPIATDTVPLSGPATFAAPATATFMPPINLTPADSVYTITAQFNESNTEPNFNASLITPASTITQTVIQAPTVISIPAGITAVYGQGVTIPVTVSADPAFSVTGFPNGPTGSISVTLDNTPVNNGNPFPLTTPGTGSTGTNQNGTVSFVLSGTPALAVGQHQLHVTYSGDGNFSAPTTYNYTLNVGKANANVVVSVISPIPPTNPVYGQFVTLQANISAASPGAGLPANGDVVTFLDGATTIGNGTVNNGIATLTLNTLPGGVHTITVQFPPGDPNLNANTGSLSGLTVNPASTSTTVSASPAGGTAVYGQPVVFTATVSPTTITPTTSVQFIVDGGSPSTVTLDANGQASLTLSNLAPGSTHTVVANYPANANFGTSSGSASQGVTAASTSTSLSTPSSTVLIGQTATFTATVTANSPSTATPLGTVTFTVDSTTQTTVGLDSSGQATLSLSSLPIGTHTITAAYGANSFFGGSGSNTVTVTVLSPTTTAISSSVNPSVFGQPVTFTVTVAAVNPSAGTPTGTVTFTVDSVPQSSPVSLDANGQATLMLSSLVFGGHSIGATYNGSAIFATSSASTPVMQTVNRASVTTVLTVSPNPPVAGQPTQFTVTVSPVSPSTGIPAGAVTFIVDGVPQTPVTLDGNGQATLAFTFAATGNHSVSASYNGNSNFSGMTTPTSIGLTVNPPGTGGTGGTGGLSGTPTPTPSPLTTLTGTPNEVWVAQVYSDLLHKTITAGDLAFWTDQLEADMPRATAAAQIANSAEYETKYIISLYNNLLFTTPAPDDPGIQLQYLNQGHSLEELRAVFFSSDAYVAAHKAAGNANAWVNAVYLDALGHAASASAQSFWSGYLGTHSLFDTALAIDTSGEAYGQLVRTWYITLLGRAPDGSASFWFNQLASGASDQSVLAGIIASGEYFVRPKAQWNVAELQSWVNKMYQDVLGRSADSNGMSTWVGVLESGGTRLDIVEQIVHSNEYRTKLINSVYEQLLHRPADAVGMNMALGLLGNGGTVEQLKANLMASSEYYFARGGGTDGGFVTAVLADALFETPAQVQGALGFWGPQLAGNTRSGLALQILQDPNAEAALVENLFQTFLRHSGNGGGDAYWAGQIANGLHDEDVVANVVASREYFARFANGQSS